MHVCVHKCVHTGTEQQIGRKSRPLIATMKKKEGEGEITVDPSDVAEAVKAENEEAEKYQSSRVSKSVSVNKG